MMLFFASVAAWVSLVGVIQNAQAAWINNHPTRQSAFIIPSVSSVSASTNNDQAISISHYHNGRKIMRRSSGGDDAAAPGESTAGVGDYVMSGLDAGSGTASGTGSTGSSTLNTTTSSSSTSTTTSLELPSVPSRNGTSRASSPPQTKTIPSSASSAKATSQTGTSSFLSQELNRTTTAMVSPIPLSRFNASSSRLSALPSVRNTSFTYGSSANGSVESCWNQWQSYWSSYDLRFVPMGLSTPTSSSTGTTTETGAFEFTFDSPSGTSTTTDIYTQTQGVDGFAITTITSTLIQTYTISSAIASTSTESFTRTVESTSLFYSPVPTNLKTPACSLPSYLPQCQSQWNSYLSAQSASTDPFGVAPHCSQATTQPGQCASLRSNYLATWNDGAASALNWGYGEQTIGAAETEVTSINGTQTNFGVSTWWPTHSTLFPGCTIGCMSCAITGGKVQLIYWPEGTTLASNMSTTSRLSAPMSAVPRNITSEIDPEANAASIRVATGFGTTFTSPTVYISYAKLYASDSCSGVGGTYFNTIVPITNSADLSSLWATMDYGAAGLNSASFNFTDLNSPVPDSIYDRQPRCAQYSNAKATWMMHDGPDTGPSTCPHTLPYEPIIIVPPSVLRSIDPSWASCSGDIRGVYDPPYALTHYSVAAAPAVPTTVSPAAASAEPASVTPAPTPAPTSQPNDPANGLMSIIGGQKSSDPQSPAAASLSQESPTPAASPTNNIGGIIPSVVAGGDQSPTQQDPATQQADPTTSSAGAAAGGNIISAVNGAGDPIAGQPNTQTPAPASQQADPTTPSDGAAAGGNIISAVNGAGDLSAGQQNAETPAPASQQADPTTPSTGAAAGGNIVSAENGAGAPSAGQPNAQAPAPATQQAATPALSPAPGDNGNNDPSIPQDGDPAVSSAQQAGAPNPVAAAPNTPAAAAAAPAQTVVGGQTISADPANSGGAVVGSQTLQPGAQTTIDSTPVSVGQQGSVAIGTSSTVNVASAPQQIDGQTIAADPSNSGGVVVAGQTLQPGAQTTINNTPVSVGQAGTIAVGGSTTVNAASAPQVLGGQTVAADPSNSGGVVIAGQTLAPGAQTTINQTPVSVGQGGTVAIGSSTVNVAPAGVPAAVTPAPAAATIGSQVVSADPVDPGALVVGGSQTLQQGQVTTIGNTPVSVAPGGVVVAGGAGGSSTIPLQAAQSPAPVAVATIGGQAISATSGQPVAVGGTTLTPGGAPATVGGQVVSLGSQGLIVGSSTAAYSGPGAATTPAAAAVTLGDITYTASSGSPFIIGSNTLSVGGPAATVSGQIVSLGSQGVVVGSSTVGYSAASTGGEGAVVIIGGNLYSASSGAPLIIGSTTLSAGGPAVTIDGQRISVGSQGVVIGSTVEPYSTISPQSESPEAAVTLGLQVYTALESSGKVVLGSITLMPGGPAQTLSGKVVSAASSGIVIDGTTQSFSTPAPVIDGITAASEASFTIAGHSYTALEVAGRQGEIVVPGANPGSSITLSVGGPAATISGQVISAASTGLVVGSQTVPYVSAIPTSDPLEVEAPFSVGGSSFTAFEVSGHSGELVIPGASVTLSVGGAATIINGETISAASNGVVVDGSTEAFETVTAATLPTISGATIGPWDRSSLTNSPSFSSPTSSPSGSPISSSGTSRLFLPWQWIAVATVLSSILCLFS